MLEVKHLTKSFGTMKAVNDVSFTIPEGTILGLIGQNGAGKSTTFRLILDFLSSDQGEVLWKGRKLTDKDYNIIGYLPEERGLYPKISIEEQLIYFAKLRGKTKQEIIPKIDFWMDKFQVKGKKTDKVKSLSKGNQQKVQLIATLIHEPELIILDEPFSGLDPVNAELLKDGIIELKEKGSCVIFSSHNMDNVEKICDHLVMLRDGEMVLDGRVNEIRQAFGRTKLFIESDLSLERILATEGVLNANLRSDGMIEANLANDEVGKVIFKEALEFGYMPVFNQLPPTLEDIFKMKVGESHE
ncbi:ABC transporter ATP-binding protein [Vagococcus salmoninarum]|uniref:Sodium ABC transporter ATP-binding protein n=1 Tax=Vagococcus salmoninarum TaxID=2739 RepID=A0A429ZGI7_9ENTE|nr:ABC transporter ATP-binding protein [Vagococcus salmoninarum]RST92785.1 sodium ABC transporter ATP-binding protein [Vagococcus salmoninarum]